MLPKPRLLQPIILLLACLTATIDVRAQDTTRTYFEFQVTKPVRQAPGSKGPRYPVELRAAGVQGEVLAQFVVDTLGQPDVTTFKVLRSSHGLLADAVQTALPEMRFTAAEVNGRKVKQLVQQPFVFAIASTDSVAKLAAKSSVPGPPSAPAPRVPLPLTPAPHTGTVEGWTLIQSVTMDSGGGAPVVLATRMYGSGGRLRVEITNNAAASSGNVVLLADSASNRRSGVMASGRIVTIGPLSAQSQTTLRTEPFVTSRKITDLGDGGRVAGVATRHYLLEDVSGTRLTLGDRTCVIERHSKTDVWNTTDASMADVGRRASAAARLLQGSVAQFEVIADTAHRDRPPGATLKSIGQRTVKDRNGALRTTVLTTEVTGYTMGSLDAALFDAPEGYQIFDASVTQYTARMDSVMRISAERVFARMMDSTTAVPGEKRTCTTSKSP